MGSCLEGEEGDADGPLRGLSSWPWANMTMVWTIVGARRPTRLVVGVSGRFRGHRDRIRGEFRSREGGVLRKMYFWTGVGDVPDNRHSEAVLVGWGRVLS